MPAPKIASGAVISSPSAAHNEPHAAIAATAIALHLAPEGAFIGEVLRVVGPVDVRVAVQAAARERDTGAGARAARPRQAGGAAAVAGRLVALLAQERRACLQEVVVIRAVRVVANGAVLLHRLVRAHEGPALLHVAAVASLVDAVLDERLLARRAVCVVAVGARDLALAHRMVRLAVDRHAELRMAGEAHIGLLGLDADTILLRMDLVARAARHVAARVLAQLPVDALAALVASEADA